MKNEHGLECPLDWGKLLSYYKWLAVDANGEIYAYENKPILLDDSHWRSVDYNFLFRGRIEAPADFTQCLWQRPK